MKKLQIILGLSLFVCIAASFMNSSSEGQKISIDQAIKNKIVSVTFISNGKYSGKSVFCKLKNLTGKPYTIVFPAGTYFKAPSVDEQDLVVPQEEFVSIIGNESKNTLLNGYCCNLSKHSPKKLGEFKLTASKNPKEFPKLLSFLKGKKYESHTIQAAVWALTNKSSVANIYGKDEKAVATLRKELFALTGQKEVWYESPQEVTVDEDGTINQETARISGNIEFKTTIGSHVYTEVLGLNGEVKIKSKGEKMPQTAVLELHFKVEVQGWKKGKYTVNVMENAKIIKSYEFIV